MKRGKDDEKVMGPLFPRLHVSDTEKGGPRAPPRNKMALYEQFSIPSQRFNQGLLPPTNTNSSSNTAPPASSSQVIIGFSSFAYSISYYDYYLFSFDLAIRDSYFLTFCGVLIPSLCYSCFTVVFCMCLIAFVSVCAR